MNNRGGPIGLKVTIIKQSYSLNRLVMMDTGVFTGEQQMSDEWLRFRAFVAARPDVPIRPLIRGGCRTPPSADVLAAYEAPFPNEASKTGARRFPELIPLDPEAAGASEGRLVMQRLVRDQRPPLVLWADTDRVLPLESVSRPFPRLFTQAGDLTVIREAGHFLQEDQGDQVGPVIRDLLIPQPRSTHAG